MKNNYYLVIAIITMFLTLSANAQDKIILKTGNNIEAKILEINPNNVKYKKFNNLDGPTLVIDKNEIHMITYENGENEIFKDNSPQKSNVSSVKKHEIKLNRNRFEASIASTGYAFNTDYDTESFSGFNSAISYERILNESGLLGLKFKGDVGFDEYDEIILTFGVALNIYPFKNAKWLYVGPSVKYGVVLYDDYYDDAESLSYLGLGLNLGSQFQITSLFGIRAGLEYHFIKIDDSDIGDMGEFQLQLGFNFSF